MPPELPPDRARLTQALAKLQAPATRSPRAAVTAQGPLGLIDGLLDLIDETIMARQIVVTNGAGAQLSMDLCSRRLLQITTEEGPGALRTISARDLTYAGGVDLDEIYGIFAAFTAPGDLVREAFPSSNTIGLEDTGLAATTMRAAWGAQRAQQSRIAPSNAPLLDLCTEVAPEDAAWLYDPGDGEAVAMGSDPAVEALAEAHGQLALNDLSPEAPWAMEIESDGASALVTLRHGSALALLALTESALPSLFRALPNLDQTTPSAERAA